MTCDAEDYPCRSRSAAELPDDYVDKADTVTVYLHSGDFGMIGPEGDPVVHFSHPQKPSRGVGRSSLVRVTVLPLLKLGLFTRRAFGMRPLTPPGPTGTAGPPPYVENSLGRRGERQL